MDACAIQLSNILVESGEFHLVKTDFASLFLIKSYVAEHIGFLEPQTLNEI